MNWIVWLLVGLLAGAIAGRLVQGRGFGLLGNIIVGVIGAFVGGFVFNLLNINVSATFWGSLITATIGAIVLLVVLNLFRR